MHNRIMNEVGAKRTTANEQIRLAIFFAVAMLCLLPFLSAAGGGDGWHQEQQLTASDADFFDLFGFTVALDGDTALVGSPGNEPSAAYIFVRSGGSWTEQAKLVQDDPQIGDDFGRSLAIDGDTAVVGADNDDDNGNNAGSVYVYTRSGTIWTQQAKLTANDASPDSWFGSSVAIDGDTILIGAEIEEENGPNAGAVYVFTGSGSSWTQQAKLLATGGTDLARFGGSVSLAGNTAVIGASLDSGVGDFAGAAYVFSRSGSNWTQQAKLTANDANDGDLFGNSVSISGNSVLVGAYSDADVDTSVGSAYVFTRSGSNWSQQAKLTPPDGAAFDSFARSVALNGDTAVIGSTGHDVTSESNGAAYLFTRNGSSWSLTSKLLADGLPLGALFGQSVSVDGDTVLIGARGIDNNGNDSGAAYVFTAGNGNETLWHTSSSSSGMVGGVSYGPEDVMQFDPSTNLWSKVFDGSAFGISADLNAFSRVSDNIWVLSFAEPTTIPGISGTVDESDAVLFFAGAGDFLLIFDGSDVGLTTADEAINGIAFDDGVGYITTVGAFDTGTVAGGGEDVLRFLPTSLGDDTAGSFEFVLDGSNLPTPIVTSLDGISANGCLGNAYLGYVWLGGQGAFGIAPAGVLDALTVWPDLFFYPLSDVDALAFGSDDCLVRGPEAEAELDAWLDDMGISAEK